MTRAAHSDEHAEEVNMRDVTFYQEFENKSKTQPSGNVLAVSRNGARCPDGSFEAVGALFDHCNSAVATTSVSPAYLREKCKRISEVKARGIHPRLFNFLDQEC